MKINEINNILKKPFDRIKTYRLILMFNKDPWKIKDLLPKLKNGGIRNQYKQAYYKILEKRGNWIGHRSQFRTPPILPHPWGIFVSDHAKIGKNCTIFQHVTIGSNELYDSKGKGAPVIGDDCYIGAGAKIIGNVTIGNNCRIGANCVVYRDMPNNSIAVLQPTRIILKEGNGIPD